MANHRSILANNKDPATILRKLVQGEEGRAWADEREKGWTSKSNTPVCEWDGIGCDTEGETVISIQLNETDFFGTLPTELALLSTISTIDIRKNLLQGTIPSEISFMQNLQIVSLKQNRLEGTIPRFLSKKLEKLDISYNQLSGEIPPDFGEGCLKLKHLDLRRNELTGFLPYGLEDLPNLRTISLSENHLHGTLPEYLSSMKSLQFLYLNDNALVGTIPEGFGKVGNSENLSPVSLREVWLENNYLSGSIPVSLSESTELVDFFVDGNKFVGSVPAVLCREKINADFFTELGEAPRDYCDSISCPAGTLSVEGIFPCKECLTNIQNPYLGRKGECDNFTEVRIVDMILGQEGIELSDSACDYKGVVCNDNQEVIEIVASGYGLKGTLPDELGLLSMLTNLDVSNNSFTGYFPSGLRFAPLRSLHIGGNRLKGIVPPLMCANAGDINGDDDDDCTTIACPMRTYSKDGTGFGECIPCPNSDGAPFLGSTNCSTSFLHKPEVHDKPEIPSIEESSGGNLSTMVYVVIFILLLCLVFFYGLNNFGGKARMRKKSASIRGVEREEEVHRRGRWTWLKWAQHRLSSGYHYLISLAETEAIDDPPVVKGQIDVGGWNERESIIRHRDLENAVEAQKDNPMAEVWEYPDPLETPKTYERQRRSFSSVSRGSNSHDDEFVIDDEDDEDISEWIRKERQDLKSKDVWLDVPRLS